MSRIVTAFVLCTVVMTGLVVAQSAPRAARCTENGGPNRDVMVGTTRDDVLCAHRGNDYLHGAEGNDRLRAGRGPDTAVGAGGRDILRGGQGDDRLFAADDRGGERVIGGLGHDQCFVDDGDQVFGCEETFRGLSVALVNALSRTILQTMRIALEVPTVTITAPPVPAPVLPAVTFTVTQTVTSPPQPQCTPPPANPPPPC